MTPNKHPSTTRTALAAAGLGALAVAGIASHAAASTGTAPTPAPDRPAAAQWDAWSSEDGVTWEHPDGRVIVVAHPRTTN